MRLETPLLVNAFRICLLIVLDTVFIFFFISHFEYIHPYLVSVCHGHTAFSHQRKLVSADFAGGRDRFLSDSRVTYCTVHTFHHLCHLFVYSKFCHLNNLNQHSSVTPRLSTTKRD